MSGPVTAHITQVRLEECKSRSDGDSREFYAAAYFSIDSHWYYVQLISEQPLPHKERSTGYTGPGTYSAVMDFREMILHPGHMVIGDRAWGVPFDHMATLTVADHEGSVMLGSFSSRYWVPKPLIAHTVDLWPQPPDSTNPRVAPTPAPEEIEHVSGSWTCH
jgi:hypothetical protein